MKGRILIHSLIFPPDGVSTAYLYGDIALALKSKGYDVVVLTTTPHYNKVPSQLAMQPMKWVVPGLLKKSNFNGIDVYHVPQKKFKSTILRMVGFVYWHIVSFIAALCFKNIDVIISPSPPITIGILNIWLGMIKGAKVIYNVQEVYPDILGMKTGVAYKILSRMERYIYNHSAAVITIDQVFYDTICPRFKNPQKLHIIPNFVDTDLYHPVSDFSDLDQTLFVKNDHLKLLYAGNIGMAQEWDTLLELAKITKDDPFDYYVIGEGVMRQYVADGIQKHDLVNVHLLPYQPRELMPKIIAFSDIQYIFMEPGIAAQGFPSKVYTIMACGKPLVVCSPSNTPIVNFLDGIGCAKIVESANVETKVSEIAKWLRTIDRNNLDGMGRNGLKSIQDNYSKDIVTTKYCDLISNL